MSLEEEEEQAINPHRAEAKNHNPNLLFINLSYKLYLANLHKNKEFLLSLRIKYNKRYHGITNYPTENL